MSNGAYKKAAEISYFKNMLPYILEQAKQSQFESRKETQKTTKAHQDFLEKYTDAIFKRALAEKGSSKTLNPFKAYKSHKSAAERQQEILRSFGTSGGMRKYKNTVFQKGIKGIGAGFDEIADSIDPDKTAQMAAMGSVLSLVDTLSTVGGVSKALGEIGKVGFKEFAKEELKEVISPLKDFKETLSKLGKGGLKDKIKKIGEGGLKGFFDKDSDLRKKIAEEGGFADLLTELSENLTGHKKGLKKLTRRFGSHMQQKAEAERGLAQRMSFEPSDYFKYITQSQNKYL
tara:strand:- start:225 stop:1088 length:864 start_codon:yes stop_codon:yes gene_type:complete